MTREIHAAKCTSCGELSYPTHFYCPSCRGAEFEPVPVGGAGKLVTWTRVYALSLDYAQRHLTVGIVEMDMGIRVTGQLDIEEPRTGMRVKARVDKVREISGTDIHGLVFSAA